MKSFESLELNVRLPCRTYKQKMNLPIKMTIV